MVRPQNPERKETTIGQVPKTLIKRIQRYAQKSNTRKGFETVPQVLDRMVEEYEKNHPTQERPRSAYDKV